MCEKKLEGTVMLFPHVKLLHCYLIRYGGGELTVGQFVFIVLCSSFVSLAGFKSTTR